MGFWWKMISPQCHSYLLQFFMLAEVRRARIEQAIQQHQDIFVKSCASKKVKLKNTVCKCKMVKHYWTTTINIIERSYKKKKSDWYYELELCESDIQNNFFTLLMTYKFSANICVQLETLLFMKHPLKLLERRKSRTIVLLPVKCPT